MIPHDMRIEIQVFILSACLVNFGLTYTQTDNEVASDQFQNVFNSVAKGGLKNGENYREFLEQGIAQERETFDTMKQELQIARYTSTHKKENLYQNSRSNVDENAVVIKREAAENDSPHPNDDCNDTGEEDIQVHLSEEKRAAIEKIQDPEIRAMLESAEIRAKKGEVLVERERNKTRVVRQKSFFSMFVCAIVHILTDLQDAYKYIDLDVNATTTQIPRERVYTSSAVENVLVRKSNFTVRQVQQVHKFFRKWCATFKANEMEFGNNLRKAVEDYVRRKGIRNYMSEIHKDFAGNMGRNYLFFSNVYHEIIANVASRFRNGGENTTFLEAFFDVTPNWYFTEQHIEYVNVLHEALSGRRDEFFWLSGTNRVNETVVIPYAREETCPSHLEHYNF